MQMWKLPPVLLLHLKRFHYTRFFRDKVCDLVHFPTRGLDLSPYLLGPGAGMARYNLLAVSNHMGRLGGGHYTANCLHTPTSKWLNFNDSWVSLFTLNIFILGFCHLRVPGVNFIIDYLFHFYRWLFAEMCSVNHERTISIGRKDYFFKF